jgi:Flp pilus assembly protein TadG
MTSRCARSRGDGGSATLELAILAPALLLIVGVMIFGGRVAIAGQSVQQAADAGAREASIARTAEHARAAAFDAVTRNLSEQRLDCAATDVQVDTSGFATGAGQAATVTVVVVCDVTAADLLIPGVPGTRRVEADAVSAIDTYRERR